MLPRLKKSLFSFFKLVHPSYTKFSLVNGISESYTYRLGKLMEYCIFFFSSKMISQLDEHLAGTVSEYIFYTPVVILEINESRIESQRTKNSLETEQN